MSSFHFCLSAAKNLSSFQLLPASLMTDLLQLFLCLPLFLFAWGFHSRAAFDISPSSFLNVWPIHLNFLFVVCYRVTLKRVFKIFETEFLQHFEAFWSKSVISTGKIRMKTYMVLCAYLGHSSLKFWRRGKFYCLGNKTNSQDTQKKITAEVYNIYFLLITSWEPP